MTKKLLGMVSLLLALICVLAACDSGNDGSDTTTSITTTASTTTSTTTSSTQGSQTPAPVKTTVTRDEWRNAFDLSKYGDFIFHSDVLLGEHGDTLVLTGFTKKENSVISKEHTVIINDDEQKLVDSYEGSIASLEDLDNYGVLGCMLYAFNNSASYGYTMFQYKEDTHSYYSNKVDMDRMPCDINIWFEDGKIVKITFFGYSSTQEMDATYAFSFDVSAK